MSKTMIERKPTRGMRNNNPLNIRHGKSRWVGMAEQQTDRAFVQFTERKYGYWAAFVLIRNYIQRFRANTIGKIVARWAPSADGNNTLAYVNYVSHTTGIPADYPLRFEDQEAIVAVVRSMAQIESGLIERTEVLNEAYVMSL